MPEGMAIYLKLDEPTLRSVYEKLGSRVQVQARETELAGLLALCAAGLMAAGGVLSLVWFGRFS